MADVPQGGTPGQNAQIIINAIWKDVTAEGRAALTNFLQKAPTDAEALSTALNTLQAAFGKLPEAIQKGTKAAGDQEKSVAALVQQYNQATAGLEQYTAAANKLQGELADIEKSQGAAAAGASDENAALGLAAVGMAQYRDKLDKLPPGLEALVKALNQVKAEASGQSKALTDDGVALQSLVSKYNAAAQAAETYRNAAVGLQARQVSADQGQGGQNADDVQRLNDAYTLAIKIAQEYEAELAKLPPGVQELSKQLDINRQALLDQSKAASQSQATVQQMTSQYEAASKGAATYGAIATKLEADLSLMRATGIGTAEEMAAVSGAQELAAKTAADYQAQVTKLGPSIGVLNKELVAAQANLKGVSSAQQGAKKPLDDTSNSFGTQLKSVEDLGRGLASSLFGFSLIAGGTVAVGHVIGNAINDSVAAYEKLRAEITTLSQMNPQLNTAAIKQQIIDLENQLGILSEDLVKVYAQVAPQAGGDQQQAGIETGIVASGAQANRQDYLAWAKALTQTMQAYNLTLLDTTHIQDVMTVAMRNSQGQGSALLDLWGSITKASSNMNTGLNDTAAIMTTIATNGGDMQENMRALKGAFDALAQPQAVKALETLGVNTKDANHNMVSLVSIVEQLHQLLGSLSQGDQAEALKKIFNDRDVVQVMTTLINNTGDLKGKLDEFAKSAGAASDAQAQFQGTQEAAADKLKATTQAVHEQIGELLDWQQHIAGIFLWISNTLPQGKAAQDKYDVQGQFPAQPSYLIDQMQAQNAAQEGLTETQKVEIDTLKEQQKQLGASYAAREKDAQKIRDQAASEQYLLNQLGLTAEQYRVYAKEQGTVLDQTAGLSVNVKGLSSDFNTLLTQAQALSQGGAFGGFGSAQEQAGANLKNNLEQAMTDAKQMQGEIRAMGLIGVSPDSVLGQLAQSLLNAKLGTIKDMVAEAQKLGVEMIKNTPEGKLAYMGYQEQQITAASTAAIAAAQENATKTTADYAAQVKVLTDQQKELQRALRDNSTPELAAAYANLTRLTKEQTDKTYDFDTQLNKLRQDLQDTKDAAKGVLDPAKESLDAATKALRDFDQTTQEGVDKDTIKLHQLQDAQKKVKDEQQGLVDSAQAVYDASDKAYQKLQDDMRLMDEQYKNQEGDLERSIQLLDRLNNATLAGVKDEVDKLARSLDDLKQKETEELRPFEDELAKEKLAVQAAQDAIEAISKKYEYLNKLQAEYDALKQQDLQMQQQQDLLNKRDTVENLVARLAAAKKGTSDYLQLSQQLVTARNQEATATKEYNLQNQIAAGQAAEKQEMDAAKDRLAQAQKEYDATQRQIDAIKNRYTIEERSIQDAMRLKQQEYDDDKKRFDGQHTEQQNKLDDLKEQQRQYDITQQAAIDAQKKLVDTAKDALTKAKEVQKAANDAQTAIVDLFSTQMRDNADQAKLWHDKLQDTVNFASDNYNTLKDFWDGQSGAIQHHIDQVNLDKSTFETQIGNEVKTAQDSYNKVRDAIQKAIDRLGDQIDVLRDTATEHEQAAQREIAAEQKKQQAIENTWSIYNAYLSFLKATGQFTGVLPPLNLPPVSEPFTPTPDKRVPYFHSPTVSPPAPTGPPPHPTTPPPGPTGHAVMNGSQGLGTTPVPAGTRNAIRGDTNVNTTFGNITVQINGTGPGGKITERDAYDAGGKIIRGLRKRLKDQYQTDAFEVGSYYG